NIKNFDENQYLFFVTKKGVVKRTHVNAFQNIRASGIRAINLKEGDELLDVRQTFGNQDVIIGASNGKAIRFNEETVRDMGRVASGVRGIRLGENDEVVGISLVGEERNQVLIVTENGYGKRTEIEEYRQQNRGGKGVKTLNVTEKNGQLVKLKSVCGDEDLIIITNKGMMIRIAIEQIAQTSRATQGVRLMRLNEGHSVATVAVVPKEEIDDILQEEVLNEQLEATKEVAHNESVETPLHIEETPSINSEITEELEDNEETNDTEKPKLNLFDDEE
ncbi:MAG: DNA gyrase C-terminal beta-propeller domain-containing protein, partial [Candidatus Izemoplasmataceae bacterium]